MVELNVTVDKTTNKEQKKSLGHDKIYAEFIKNLEHRGKILLLNIFNKMWTGESSMPTPWKKVLIILI